MRVSDKAIVLQAVKYGDRKLMLKLFSKHNGLLTAAAYIGASASSKIRSGTIQPLNLLDVQLVKKQNREVLNLTEASSYYISNAVSGSISRLSIAQFMNEILIKSVKEQPANSHLFDFIEGCLKFLNESGDEHLNLHIYFLIELTKYLGIEPNNNYSSDNIFFDCREGRFGSVGLAFPLGLSAEESAFFSEALKVNYLKEKLTNSRRQKLLEILVVYYQMHVPGFNQLRSMDVLREVVTA